MKSKPIRIAQIMGKMNSGGVESVVMNYYMNINRDNIQFDFIVDENSTNIPYEKIKSLGGNIILIPPYYKIISYVRSLINILKKNRYKIVHSHLNVLSVFPLYAAKKSKVPIRIAHSHSTSNKKEYKKNLMKKILRPLSKIYSTHYFCCSEMAGRWLFGNRSYNDGEVILLNNAINIEKFAYDEKIRNNIREELNINDKIVIGHVGRFVEQKNHKRLIDIFNKVHKKNKNTVLLLVGEGPLLEDVMSRVHELNLGDSVIYLGIRKDVHKLMQAMDIFMLPSLYEGLPVVGVEAQASGLLCILSDEMTKETQILDSTKFLPLSKLDDEWADITLNSYFEFERKIVEDQIKNANWDIKIESKKLENIYLDLVEEN